jgi:hypothetical protein
MTWLAVYGSALMSNGGFASWAATASRLALPLWAFGLALLGGYLGGLCWKRSLVGSMRPAAGDKDQRASIVGPGAGPAVGVRK